MTDVRLPFWIVTDRKAEQAPRFEPCNDPAAVHGFTNTSVLIRFLEKRTAGDWKVSLVARADRLVLILADLYHTGHRSLCFNPMPDGAGGEHVPLADLFAQIDGHEGVRLS